MTKDISILLRESSDEMNKLPWKVGEGKSLDELEIESWRYSGRAFFILPLSSGSIAILTPNRELYCVCSDWQSVLDNGPDAQAAQIEKYRKAPVQFSIEGIDAEGLDL